VGGVVTVICPDCDAELEPLGPPGGTRLRPSDDWTCPAWGARWRLDYSGLLTETE
jgi:hypothetical protein